MLKAIIGILLLWTFLGIFVIAKYEDISEVFAKSSGQACPYLNPVWLYENYKVNYFGAFLLTILFNIICPLLSIFYWIVTFIKWICTAGRK